MSHHLISATPTYDKKEQQVR